jgi:hypothetical protein
MTDGMLQQYTEAKTTLHSPAGSRHRRQNHSQIEALLGATDGTLPAGDFAQRGFVGKTSRGLHGFNPRKSSGHSLLLTANSVTVPTKFNAR